MADSSITPLSADLGFTFDTIYATVNAIINAIATEIVTADGSAAGSLTVGNGYVTGIFGATTLITSGIRGGNTTVGANLVITSNVTVNSSSSIVVGNTSINSTFITANNILGSFQNPIVLGNTSMYSLAFQTTGTSAQQIDSFTFISYRSADYYINVKDNNANNYLSTKLAVIHDSGQAYYTEYATMGTNTQNMGTFVANANTTAVTLYFTPVSSNTTVKMIRLNQSI